MLYIQKMPRMYYAYVLFPVYFWNHILRNYRSLFEALRLSLASGIVRFTVITIASILFLQALVRSYMSKWDPNSRFLTTSFLTGWQFLLP